MVLEIRSEEEFHRLINDRRYKASIVKFFAPWCKPCQSIGPVFDQLAREHHQIQFLAVNVDSFPLLAALNDVHALPTFCVFGNGAKIHENIMGIKHEDLHRVVKKFSHDQHQHQHHYSSYDHYDHSANRGHENHHNTYANNHHHYSHRDHPYQHEQHHYANKQHHYNDGVHYKSSKSKDILKKNHVDNSFIDQSSYQGKYLEIHPYYRNHLGDPLNPFQTNNHGAVSKIGNNYIYAGKI